MPEQPVFVDPTGRRARRVHRMGRILVVPALGYMVALGSSLMGGPSLPSVLVPGQAQDAETASYVEFRDGVVVTPSADEDAAAVPPAEDASSAPGDGQLAIREASSEADSADVDSAEAIPDAQQPASKPPAEEAGAKDRGRSKQSGVAARPDHAGSGAANADGRGTKPKKKDKKKDKGSPAAPSTPGPGTEPGNVPGV